MNKDSIRQIGISAATFILLGNYVLADLIPYNGISTFEASKKISIYFQPARFTYSIWLLIFLGLIVFTIYQALPAQKENLTLRKIGWWYVTGIAALTAWMFFLHYESYLLLTLMMIILLITLLVIYEKLGIGIENVSRGMKLLVHLPFSVYLGWITMATIGNVSNYLTITGWNGFGINPKIWVVVMMVVTIVIAELTAFNRQDLAYLAVFVWSFIGIAVNHKGVSPIFEAACVSAGIVIVITTVTIIFRPKLRNQ